MPRHRAWSTGYALRGKGRLIGDCLTEDCAGELRVGTANDITVITCTLCGAVWAPDRWQELADLLNAQAGVAA